MFEILFLLKTKVNLCSDSDDKLKIYRENFEKAYLEALVEFYSIFTQQFISNNGIIAYLTYADAKLKEEEKRGIKYLETSKKSDSIELVLF
jgi:cullin 5